MSGNKHTQDDYPYRQGKRLQQTKFSYDTAFICVIVLVILVFILVIFQS